MPKKYTVSQFQQRLFSPAARQSPTPGPQPPTPYPFTCPWQGQRDPYAALAAYAAVARGELPHDDRPKPPACTFCDRPAADLPTAEELCESF